MTVGGRFVRWLAEPAAAWRSALIAVLLSLPALGNGIIADDHFLRATSLGLNPPALALATKWDLFRFFSGDPALYARWLDLGLAPWWASPDLRVGFWRPISSALHQVDFALWPNHPVLMHAHSLAWLAALVLVAGALFRRWHAAPWAAGLATLVFAIDDGHGIPIGWLANRNALVAAVFGGLAVLAHDRWRRDGWRPGGVLSWVALTAGLLSGEIALGAWAGVLAHTLAFEKGLRAGLLALAPSLAVVIGWRVAYSQLGYGAHGSGLYLDPVHSPLAFASQVSQRLPLLLFAQLGGLPSDPWALVPRQAALGLVVVAAAGCAALGFGLRRLFQRDRLARFYGLWLVLAVLPGCATFPNDRLLLIASIPSAGLVAHGIGLWRQGKGVSRALALYWVLVHLVMAPLLLPVRARSIHAFGEMAERALRGVPRELGGKTLVVLSAPDGLMCVQILAHGASLGHSMPDRLRCIGVTTGAVRISRPDERTLELRSEAGFFSGTLDALFRSPERAWHLGEGPSTAVVSTQVIALTPSGLPAALRARFDAPLDDPGSVLVIWRGRGYQRFVPPPVGQSVEHPPTSMAEVLFGL